MPDTKKIAAKRIEDVPARLREAFTHMSCRYLGLEMIPVEYELGPSQDILYIMDAENRTHTLKVDKRKNSYAHNLLINGRPQIVGVGIWTA